MTGWIIAALPAEDHPIQQVSSEALAHMTVIYLGEQESGPTLSSIMNAVAELAQFMPEFTLDVTERKALGDNKADVLMLGDGGIDTITNAREVMLQNPVIRAAFDSAEQFPTWTPHVTLGYPELPAMGPVTFDSVRFNRLTVWALDSDGPTFTLNATSGEEMSHMEDVESFLAHHGIKGMRWGFRRTDKQLDAAAGRKPDADDVSLKKMKPGSVITKVQSDGSTKVLIKNKNGSWDETRISADAERFVKAQSKEQHEMSDRELKETVARARLVEDYNKFFGPQPNAELKSQVEQLDLQMKYGSMKAKLNPSTATKVKGLVAGSAAAYVSYKKLDKESGGALSKTVAAAFGKSSGASAATAPAAAVVKEATQAFRVNPSKVKIRPSTPKG